ncbi:MAG: ferrichrome ABC transporter permease [bacterium]|jgi:spermidine synthase|nr:ferrichrome ABC transporter permease [Deltaproteobacteria bacterium]MCP4242299.1 ferrichrome ABC transporter permease [bacterium]MDP7300792.1 fused MFS/spermidine synthase [Myxococcota bacterium]HJO22719.1 fused MFS/spermidine synthase [Myxococcota bacterium]
MNPRHDVVGGALFVVSVFASAFLIFLVQPMVGKRILPWFGGVPAVWMLCLAFYQSTLFLGYAYAHFLIRFVRASRQFAIHAILIGTALVALPVLPGDHWQPLGASSPEVEILIMLVANVALPFVVLASTGPLVQAWFARRYPGRSPYPLYAVSNLGSLLALVAYPVLLEPQLGLSDTGDLWAIAFGVTAALVLACAALAWRSPSDSGDSLEVDRSEGTERLSALRVVLWLLLSASAVLVLMGVTNKLCLDIASAPFLWILPLATYLLTLILCFASESLYSRIPYAALALAALVLTVGLPLWLGWVDPSVQSFFGSIDLQITCFCLLLFSVGMMMHGELYRLRPPAHALTAFYLCVAGGGALGGIFVGIMAPVLFDAYYELELGLALAWILFPIACAYGRSALPTTRTARWSPAVVATLAVALIAYNMGTTGFNPKDLRYQERTFFGILRLVERGEEDNRQLHLLNGTTLHGVQFSNPELRGLASSYYGPATAIGLLVSNLDPEVSVRVGVIGLGAGTLAAYGRDGDLFRFYEIDPAVVRIARDDGYFDFLSASPAEIEVVVGDARLSLAREQSEGIEQDFDILVVDAFSSDAIPVHLLTEEAFRHYADTLAPDGLLAVHVTNRYMDIRYQVSRQGLASGLTALHVSTLQAKRFRSMPSEWVLLSRDPNRIQRLTARIARYYNRLGLRASGIRIGLPASAFLQDIPVWTDDYSDLFSQILDLPKPGSLRSGFVTSDE